MSCIRLAIVDDSKGVALGVRRAFKDFVSARRDSGSKFGSESPLDFEVRLFGGPEEWTLALQGMRPEEEPHVCLLDVAMGGDSEAGFKLARMARSRFPEATIVMFSGFDDASTLTSSPT